MIPHKSSIERFEINSLKLSLDKKNKIESGFTNLQNSVRNEDKISVKHNVDGNKDYISISVNTDINNSIPPFHLTKETLSTESFVASSVELLSKFVEGKQLSDVHPEILNRLDVLRVSLGNIFQNSDKKLIDGFVDIDNISESILTPVDYLRSVKFAQPIPAGINVMRYLSLKYPSELVERYGDVTLGVLKEAAPRSIYKAVYSYINMKHKIKEMKNPSCFSINKKYSQFWDKIQ